MIDRRQDISGERFGCLTAARFHHRDKKTYWVCQCDCGKETIVSRDKLIGGVTRSCGHLRGGKSKFNKVDFKKVELSEKDIKWLVAHYKHTKNSEILERFGFTNGTLHKFARQLGLSKSPQFIKKVRAENTELARLSHLKNGTFPPKGYRIPRSEEFCFKKGVNNEMRLGKKRNEERIEKLSSTLKRIRREEKARVMFGFHQLTKLNVNGSPRRVHSQRHYLKKRGYIIDKYTAYWTEETQRATRMEGGKVQTAFRFKPYPATI